MKIAVLTIVAAVGLALAGCGGGGNDNNASTSGTGGGSGSGSGGTGPIGPTSSDFVAFVNSQVLTQPAFGSSAPTATTTLTTDFALDTPGVFTYEFNAGDMLPAGTFQASVACTQAGMAKCNPALSTDLNSTLN